MVNQSTTCGVGGSCGSEAVQNRGIRHAGSERYSAQARMVLSRLELLFLEKSIRGGASTLCPGVTRELYGFSFNASNRARSFHWAGEPRRSVSCNTTS